MAEISRSKIDEYYEALVNRDTQYVGIFFVGVTTTSVFCIATCRARKPLKKNVVFYSNFADALKNGFRPCKICKPTINAHEAPEEVEKAITLVRENPKEKITDYRLRQEQISPDKLRRWFKKQYGITYHAYQRMYRINNAYKELKDGKKSDEAAYNQGFESLSGFHYTYKKLLGNSPAKSKGRSVILINRLTTPLGPMIICSTDAGICLLEFTDRKMLETEFKDLQKMLKAEILIGENAHTKQAKKELKEYFSGLRTTFSVKLHRVGSSFQQMAWDGLMVIPYGSTRSYEQQAQSLADPSVARAVARANGYNRISIMVPCHRIIGKDGHLTGYGGGLERKKWLLDFEKEHAQSRMH